MDTREVREGLELLFWGNILAIAALIPLIGIFFLLAGFVVQMVGLVKLKREDSNYEIAFYLVIAGIIIGFFRGGHGMFATVMQWIGMIVSCAEVYMICTGTEYCVGRYSRQAADSCVSVRAWYVVCTAAAVILGIVAQIPIIGILAVIASIVVAILQLVASIRYLMMLWKCKNVL